MNKKTLIIDFNQESIDSPIGKELLEKAAQILKDGGTVIFPTETVYGLGGNAFDSSAARKIYEAKGRPSDNPLIVHIADRKDLEPLVKEVGERECLLMDRFWPGPLTIIFHKSDKIPYETTGGLDTVAVRMPADEIARFLIRKSEVAVAAPSANLSGSPSLTSGRFVLEEMKGKVDVIILHRDSEIGLESTVIDMTQPTPIILRPGKISREEIESLLQIPVKIDPSLNDPSQRPKSPGMKYRHYSPKAQVILLSGSSEEQYKKASSELHRLSLEGKKVLVAVLSDRVALYGQYALNIGRNSREAAKNLFRLMRIADEKKVDCLIFESLCGDSMAEALMNRIRKAAGEDIR